MKKNTLLLWLPRKLLHSMQRFGNGAFSKLIGIYIIIKHYMAAWRYKTFLREKEKHFTSEIL